MTSQLDRAIQYLSADALRHITLLKMLSLFGEAIECHYLAEQGAQGVLLLLPTQAFSFDRETYPATQYVVLLSATSQGIARALLERVPRQKPLVFKLLDTATRESAQQLFALRRVTAFVSYTARRGRRFAPAPGVRVSKRIDEQCYALYAAQGHSRDDMERYFGSGQARSFTIYQADSTVASCFAYRNYADVYEIAGLYTLPSARRRGYARQLVETALHSLATDQLVPRYQVHENNLASIRLAEAIGLERFATLEHWITTDCQVA